MMAQEFKDEAFIKLMETTSNRRLIQHLRLRLFQKVDFTPEKLVELNLQNSEIEKETQQTIKFTAESILEELSNNVFIYDRYFKPSHYEGDLRNSFLKAEVRGYLLRNEEYKFGWEIFYLEYLAKFLHDNDRLENDPIGYYQKLYDYIVLDMDYDGEYECYH